MLSFDITDRNIRVVKGTETSNGKIKITAAATISLAEDLIVNGHVKDAPSVATQINNALKKNKMPDREAIVSISSNLTIFKEMIVPKVKSQELQKIVKQQVQAELNLDDSSHSVSYIIVGQTDGSENGGEPSYRILATACPYEIVNSYREVFRLLAIPLRSVMIGCNCITRVLLADTKIRSKMPLLAVQIDNNFISLNLYEQGSLSFSRFASIDAADYGYSDDYVFEAVNENIFRMLQFHRSRNTGETIENVIFYGDTHDYVRLTDELEKLDLKTSLINVPPQIHGHENLEFSLYANAIGAMFKRNKELERVNLLETDLGTAVKNKIKNDNSGNIILVGTLVATLAIVGGIYGVMWAKDKGIQNDTKEAEDWVNSTETKEDLQYITDLEAEKEKVNDYYTRINNARVAFDSQPVILGKKYDILRDTIIELAKDEKYHISDMAENGSYWGRSGYSAGKLSIDVKIPATEEDMAQKFASDYVEAILNLKENGKNIYRKAVYTGYSVEKASAEEKQKNPDKKDMLKFSVDLELTGENNPASDLIKKDDGASDEKKD